MNKYTILLIALSFFGILEAKDVVNKDKVDPKLKKNRAKENRNSLKVLPKKKEQSDKSILPIPVTEEKNNSDDVVIELN